MAADSSVSSMPEAPIDISETIDALCGCLGLDKTLVKQIVFEPGLLTFTTFEVNEEGKKFIKDDGFVATCERSYRVTT